MSYSFKGRVRYSEIGENGCLTLPGIQDYYQDCCRRIIATREQTRRELLRLGLTVTASQANFLLARHNVLTGEELYARLKERGLLVRHFSQPRIQDWIRITIGDPDQMELLLSHITAILQEEDQL